MGTERQWFDGAGSDPEFEINLDSLAANNYSVGAQADLGASFVPYVFAWRVKIEMDDTPNAGESIQIYAAAARDGASTVLDGGWSDTASDDQTDRDRLNNLKHIGNAYSDGQTMIYGSGQFVWWERYFSPVILNATEEAIHNSTGDNTFIIEDLVKA